MEQKVVRLISLSLLAAILAGIPFVMAQTRSSTAGVRQAARKPSVVFILGDDLAYCDVSMYGCKEIPTTNIDSIGGNPIRFTNAYVSAPHEVLCWRNRANAAVRKGNWKLFKRRDHYWRFDMSKDIGEQKNLAAEHPEIVEQLQKELAKWEAQMKAPLWPCRKAPGSIWEVDGVKLDICI